MKILVGPNPMGLESVLPELRSTYPALEFVYCGDRKALADAIADADVYMGWLDRDILSSAKKLRWIQSPSTGVNYYLAIPELVQSDVLLTSARGTHAACLAESALGMILAFTRGIRECVIRQPERRWPNREIRPKLVELTGSTMGIVGLGTVGRALAKRAHAFDIRVIAVDLYPASKPGYVSELWGLERLNDLLSQSDYVVVTVPWTPDTDGMIGAAEMAWIKPTAILVGISRGGIIDQKALAAALREGRLAAAALDVTKPEPLPEDSELWELDNLLIMPHIAGGTQFEAQHVLEIFRENLERLVNGGFPLRNQIDKQRGF